MIELKSCPFCGGEAKIEEIGGQKPNGTKSVRVYCDNFSVNGHERNEPCPMGFLSQIFESKKIAIAAWNRREPEGRTNEY